MNTKNYFQEIGAWPPKGAPSGPRHTHSLVRTYIIGFILSLALTFAAYFLATHTATSTMSLFVALLTLAVAQFVVQLVCFLHLGTERSSRERLVILGSALVVVLILVVGSLWIMTHLNARMMADPAAMQQYMDSQSGL